MKQPSMTRQHSRVITVWLMSLVLVAFVVGCESSPDPSSTAGTAETAPAVDVAWIEYPEATRGEDVDVHHGVEVPDPYRWMEDEAAAETQAWLSKQDGIAARLFGQLPEHQAVVDYLEKNWLDGVVSVPVRNGDRTFFWKAAEGKSHNILYMQKGDGEPEVIFNLNERNPEEVVSTRTTLYPSPEGRYVGYPIHRAGADMAEIRFYDTESGKELEDHIPTALTFVTGWLPEESGFLYTWLDLPTLMGRDSDKEPGVYLHTMGTPPDKDKLIYGRSWEGQFMAAAVLTEDEKSLLINDLNIMGNRGRWGVRPLEGGAETPVTWLMEPEAEYRFAYIGDSGSELYLVTDYESPNWRIVAAGINKPGLANLREVVPEGEEPISIIAGTNSGHIVLHEERLYVTYIQHTSHIIRIFDLQGEPQGEIDLPFMGSVTAIATKKDDPILHIGLTSFLVPQSIYAFDTAEKTLAPVEVVETPADFGSYEVTRVFYDSFDGKRIPMSIIQRAGTPRDGQAKTILYGYGGWGIPWLPRFDNRIHTWLHMGGTYVIANLRGGGEYGDAWHKAGQFMNKQDVFKDFYAAAEYLVDEKYTSPSLITIVGGSNGGLLTASAYNQRPELFGAVVSEVAAVDMLRIQDTPIGATATMELGSPRQSKEMFEYLKSYSPLHNVRHEGPYPPILHMVGENDPRCKPGHIYKYVAEMQRMRDPGRVAVLRLIRGAGHGSGRKDDMKGWFADEVAFAWAMTEVRQPDSL
jgi:prolyl oligopeptidase